MKTNPNDPISAYVLSPEEYATGLTIREYFSALAMQGMMEDTMVGRKGTPNSKK